MLEFLNNRRREMEDPHGSAARRPSMYHHSPSNGSIGSRNGGGSHHGSFTYAPSPQTLPVGPSSYRQPSITGYTMTNYNTRHGQPQAMPPAFNTANPFSSAPEHRQPHYSPPVQPYRQMDSGETYLPPHQYTDLAPPFQPHPNFNTHPSHQFGAWGGYGAPPATGAPDTLDEENAVPPNVTAAEYHV